MPFPEGYTEYICSFMKLMTKRGHSRYILPCFREYERLWYEYSGIAVADVTTAVPLTPEEKNALHAKLEGLPEEQSKCAVMSIPRLSEAFR